jgi:hypothetical protein
MEEANLQFAILFRGFGEWTKRLDTGGYCACEFRSGSHRKYALNPIEKIIPLGSDGNIKNSSSLHPRL